MSPTEQRNQDGTSTSNQRVHQNIASALDALNIQLLEIEIEFCFRKDSKVINGHLKEANKNLSDALRFIDDFFTKLRIDSDQSIAR
jgi:hypothetical protein